MMTQCGTLATQPRYVMQTPPFHHTTLDLLVQSPSRKFEDAWKRKGLDFDWESFNGDPIAQYVRGPFSNGSVCMPVPKFDNFVFYVEVCADDNGCLLQLVEMAALLRLNPWCKPHEHVLKVYFLDARYYMNFVGMHPRNCASVC